MLLCKQTEYPNFNKEIKIDSGSIIESEAWPIIDFEKPDRFPPQLSASVDLLPLVWWTSDLRC